MSFWPLVLLISMGLLLVLSICEAALNLIKRSGVGLKTGVVIQRLLRIVGVIWLSSVPLGMVDGLLDHYQQNLATVQDKQRVKATVTIAPDEDGLAELRKAVASQDQRWTEALLQTKGYFVVPNGTQVAILDRGLMWTSPTKVRLIDGDYQGRTGFIADGDLQEMREGGLNQGQRRLHPIMIPLTIITLLALYSLVEVSKPPATDSK